MVRDEIEGRKKRGGFRGPTGEKMTEERRRDRESSEGRAGGTGRSVTPEAERVPRNTPGTDRDKKNPMEPGGI
jgi:hypothetical protein